MMAETAQRFKVEAKYVLRDKNGNVLPIWQENRAGAWLRTKLGWDIQKWPLGKWVNERVSTTWQP